jgi:hypothetical protein
VLGGVDKLGLREFSLIPGYIGYNGLEAAYFTLD